MGTAIKRNDFKNQYPHISQGLFIFEKEKHIPKDQESLNIGEKLSRVLMDIEPDKRKTRAPDFLRDILEEYKAVNIEHIEILFTPSLDMDPVATILAYCRNKKICVVWPGKIQGERLIYSEPGSLEYYETNYKGFIDTYVITGGM